MDELGGLAKAVELAKRRAGLPLEDFACEVVQYPPKPKIPAVVKAIMRYREEEQEEAAWLADGRGGDKHGGRRQQPGQGAAGLLGLMMAAAVGVDGGGEGRALGQVLGMLPRELREAVQSAELASTGGGVAMVSHDALDALAAVRK